ncbi:hypothetical protein K402DRAFT_336143 [Aulographum hederae CBS 113979]|uniref:T6SS Phospholipase effector Tle1-like catalytic domain-containing protein n=1 Tax=Aulographum hederae CBS 113979 TaxID=1176131 RepID=A0A6G1GUH9_9PEZI|nr:hypothetical protein K402DRAFT_336143 [Aulographum hederae CBS 113979]
MLPQTAVVEKKRRRRKFVLCFDGTGNKFSGTDADSNILKIYRMLDRNDDCQYHYYQPGIGTYVSTTAFSHRSHFQRFKSWYIKAKDSAVGLSFDEHVMGGYKFLMRYYVPGDDIYFFGFSRGAYTARFLAEMLDHVGLLSAGNEEMCRFAWKTFQKWQTRQNKTEREKEDKRLLLAFMCAFRETFSRPVRRIRFLGLFDTVNSVPQFENAWMQRSKFPYTARSTAKVIRHAVAIDERRAKFRQDLISEMKRSHTKHRHRHLNLFDGDDEEEEQQESAKRYEHSKAALPGRPSVDSGRYQPAPKKQNSLFPPEYFRDRSETSGIRSLSPGADGGLRDSVDDNVSVISEISLPPMGNYDDSESDGEGEQDIQEVWFAGCHADIGGGWPLDEGHDAALSHIPLVWMVREAQHAGLNFDNVKLKALNCAPDDESPEIADPSNRRMSTAAGSPNSLRRKSRAIPQIEVAPPSPPPSEPPSASLPGEGSASSGGKVLIHTPITTTGTTSTHDLGSKDSHSAFHRLLHFAATQGRIHDVLCFDNGASPASVISWNIMEHLPFRRMDLQPDGSWKSITWPLPKGEVRDVPDDVVVHNSVIKRMRADEGYRPGNLICGGGGRGVRVAPRELGIGEWRVGREEGDVVGEVWCRIGRPMGVQRKSTGESGSGWSGRLEGWGMKSRK